MKTRFTLLVAFIVLVANILSGCKKDEEEIQPKDFEYAENLTIIDSTELNTITSLDEQGNIILPSGTSLAGKFQVGMVIAGGISDSTPYGFLKKITGISSDGANTTVTTENATFEDAFINASVRFTKQLTISDVPATNRYKNGICLKSTDGEGFFIEAEEVVLYDYDQNPETTGDQIKADGDIFIDPVVHFDFDVRNRRLESVYFSVECTQSTELNIFAGSEVLAREAEWSLIRIPMNPLYIQAGILPVVVVPVLEITVGAKVEVNVRVQTEVSQSSTLEFGVQYQEGSWEPISHAEISFTYQPPQLSASVEVKGYFGPQFNLLLYGVAGPYTDANAFLKLEADVFDSPWWTLYGGGEVGVGVQVDFLGKTIADFYLPNVLNYQQIVAQATGGTEGTIKGSVKDALTQSGLAGVEIKVKKENQYAGLTVSDPDGQFHVASPVGDNISVEFAKNGYLPVLYHNVSVSVNEDTHLEPVMQIDEAHGGNGAVSGIILNALDGSGINGCTLSLRSGINATEGFIVTSGISEENGVYTIQGLPAGHYTMQCQKQGFNDSYFTVVCIGGQNQDNQNGTMTPILNENEIRIILTWGETPADLDSHLTGPQPNGARFHVYFNAPAHYLNGMINAALDHDDVNSYGPETVSIYNLSQGTYRYSVHDFTNRNAGYSMALSNSAAQVRVYQGSILVAAFNVPANTEGTLWTVFEITDGQFLPVNSLTYVASSGAVTAPNVSNDAWHIKNLPPKKGGR